MITTDPMAIRPIMLSRLPVASRPDRRQSDSRPPAVGGAERISGPGRYKTTVGDGRPTKWVPASASGGSVRTGRVGDEGGEVAKSVCLNHVAMSVPNGSLTEEFRADVNEFYGALLGWREVEALRLPDRMTIVVGQGTYINVRERDDAMHATGYEHFGVVLSTAQELEEVRGAVVAHGIAATEVTTTADKVLSFRFHHLLPLAVEVQHLM
jgi:hypothetical protein